MRVSVSVINYNTKVIYYNEISIACLFTFFIINFFEYDYILFYVMEWNALLLGNRKHIATSVHA